MTSASGKWWRIGAWNAGLAALVATGIVLGIVLLGPKGATGARGSQEPPAEWLPADAPGLQRAPASGRGLAKAGLTGTTGALHVLVVRETDYKTPVAGAAVQVVATGVPVRTARTDAGGAATFEDLPRGGWRVSAAAVGYVVSEERTVREDAEGHATLGFALEEAGALHGRVVEAATGRGVAGARVTALEGGAVCINPFGEQTLGRTFGTDTTDPDGGFMVDGVAVSPRCSVPLVRVDASGYRTLWRVAPHPGEDAGFEVRLVPGGTVQGTVTMPDGSGVAGATVLAAIDPWGTADPTAESSHVTLPRRFYDWLARSDASLQRDDDAWVALAVSTDERGHFVLDGLGLGERYTVAATAPRFGASETARGVRVTRQDAPGHVDLLLRTPCHLTVRCTDEEGQPWPHLSVRIEPGRGYGPARARGETDETGSVSFDGLTPGDYYVRVTDDVRGGEACPKIQATAGDLDVPLRLPGTPTRPKGDPHSHHLAGLPHRPAPASPRQPTMTLRLAVPDGVTPPEAVRLHASWGGNSSQSGTGSTEAWKPDATGTVPVAWDVDMSPRFRLTVEADGFLPVAREVEATQGVKADLGTITLDSGETLVASVVLPDASPLAGVLVAVQFPAGPRLSPFSALDEEGTAGPPTYERTVRTEPDGSFCLRGLPKGSVTVRLEDRRFLPFEADFSVPSPIPRPRLVVHLGGILLVHAVGVEGLPAPRCGVTIRAEGDGARGGYEASGPTDVEGLFRARLAPGAHVVEVTPVHEYQAEQTARSVVVVQDGETADVRILVPGR